ncbi:MAG: dUTP diphosphatase, partial [Spirochaetota bacterium]|nr:dUTP diphosphatase [Spirochaetota bacterium]
ASGMDLYACIEEDVTILPMQWKLIPTGFAMSLNPGYEAQIRPRSGLALEHGITVLNSPGTIDSDYRGEVKILLINLGNNSFKIQPKMRIAQMIINKVFRGDIQIVDSLKESSRGSGGFGSTGKL